MRSLGQVMSALQQHATRMGVDLKVEFRNGLWRVSLGDVIYYMGTSQDEGVRETARRLGV